MDVVDTTGMGGRGKSGYVQEKTNGSE